MCGLLGSDSVDSATCWFGALFGPVLRWGLATEWAGGVVLCGELGRESPGARVSGARGLQPSLCRFSGSEDR